MPLTWKLIKEYRREDSPDPDYVECRVWQAFSGKVRIVEVRVWYGDHNGANSTPGTVHMAKVTGRWKTTWLSSGYTWKPDAPYKPACEDDKVPQDWVNAKWALFLSEAGLKEVA